MVTAEDAPGDGLRRVILRVHGTSLFLMTVAALVTITVGYTTGTGLYGMLPDQPIGFGGLYQAYALMFIIGIVLWIGSTQARPRLFDVIGLLAHLPLLAANIFFPDVFDQVLGGNVVAVSFPIHGGFVALETFALLWKGRSQRTTPARA